MKYALIPLIFFSVLQATSAHESPRTDFSFHNVSLYELIEHASQRLNKIIIADEGLCETFTIVAPVANQQEIRALFLSAMTRHGYNVVPKGPGIESEAPASHALAPMWSNGAHLNTHL